MAIYSHKRRNPKTGAIESTGSLVLDRMVLGVRVRKATGLPDTKDGRRTAVSYDRMIDALVGRGRSDLVLAWVENRLTLHELYAAYRVGGELPNVGGLRALEPLVQQWLAQPGMSESHRVATAKVWKQILAPAPLSVTLDALPTLLEEERARCARKRAARSWAKARAAALALVRDTVGRRSPLWNTIADMTLLKNTRPPRRPPTFEAAITAARNLPPPYRDMWVAMCATGTGPHELLHCLWELEDGGLRIRGTKRAARDRLVPVLVQEKPVVRTYQMIVKALKPFGLAPYDGRRIFAQAMEEAGIPRSRRMAYLGHAAGDVTALYERQEVRAYLQQDAERLRAALGPILEQLAVGAETAVAPAVESGADPHRRQPQAAER